MTLCTEGSTLRRIPVLLSLVFSSVTMATPPTVTISYSPSLDTTCALVRGYEIKKEWKEELAQNIKRFGGMWAELGPKLLSTIEKITGRPFSGKTIAAHLTLCDLPSQALFGISINMRYALSSFTKSPVPMRYKIGVLYHEILHGFVDDHPLGQSPLLAQHQGEAPRVREHLHLLALQKAVYLDLGMKDELTEVIEIDSQLPGGFYKRAWQVVNQRQDDYLKYVEELKVREP